MHMKIPMTVVELFLLIPKYGVQKIYNLTMAPIILPPFRTCSNRHRLVPPNRQASLGSNRHCCSAAGSAAQAPRGSWSCAGARSRLWNRPAWAVRKCGYFHLVGG